MPALQAMAAMALVPVGPPVSRPRTVWVTGVKGWYSANWRSPAGMVAVTTNALDRNGSRVRNMGVLLAVSTLLAARPRAADSQMSANANSASTPAAASHSRALALDRKPMARETPATSTRTARVYSRLPTTWPLSTAAREMAMVRNLSMMPPVMSLATEIAVPRAADATVMIRMPGTT